MITNQLCLVLLGSYRFFSRKFHDRDPLSSVLSCFCFFFYPFLGGELFGQVKFISGFFPSSDLIFPFIFIFCKWANEPLLDLKAKSARPPGGADWKWQWHLATMNPSFPTIRCTCFVTNFPWRCDGHVEEWKSFFELIWKCCILLRVRC